MGTPSNISRIAGFGGLPSQGSAKELILAWVKTPPLNCEWSIVFRPLDTMLRWCSLPRRSTWWCRAEPPKSNNFVTLERNSWPSDRARCCTR
jgi:hypothetical protein